MRPNFLRAALIAYPVAGVGEFSLRRLSIAELRNLGEISKGDSVAAIAAAVALALLGLDGQPIFSSADEVLAELDLSQLSTIGQDITAHSNGQPLPSRSTAEASKEIAGEAQPAN